MTYLIILFVVVAFFATVFVIGRRYFNKDARAQRELDKYLRRNLSTYEIGRLYERYIGHLYETDGYDVIYNGAVNGYFDLGRDLIVRSVDDVLVIQTKCWAKRRLVKEKHIFQLFGSLVHYNRTVRYKSRPARAVYFTTSRYSKTAWKAAKVLGVELKILELKRTYPMIKCHTSAKGQKIYLLPFDADYDKIKIDLHREDYFVQTVKEAIDKGFRRAA